MDLEILFPEIIPSYSFVMVKVASVSRSKRRRREKTKAKSLLKAEGDSTIENPASPRFMSIQSFSMNHNKISKAKRRRLKKQAKAGLLGMDKVIDPPSDAPPRDLTVKDEVVVRLADAPPSFDEDLSVQDEVIDQLSDAPPSINLAYDGSALFLTSILSEELRICVDDSLVLITSPRERKLGDGSVSFKYLFGMLSLFQLVGRKLGQ